MKKSMLPVLMILVLFGCGVALGVGVQCSDPCSVWPCETWCTYEEITLGVGVPSVCVVGLGRQTKCTLLGGCDDNTDCSDDFFGMTAGTIAAGECVEVITIAPLPNNPARFCRNARCPTAATTQATHYPSDHKGAFCLIALPCWEGFHATELLTIEGTWDASAGRCVQCGAGASDIFEIEICGDSGGTYVTRNDAWCGDSTCGVGTSGHLSCMDIPDTCELSCPGAVDTACDEKVSGEQCAIGANCESTGVACSAGVTCNDACQCGTPVCTHQLCEAENGLLGTPLPCACGSEIADGAKPWCCATVDIFNTEANCNSNCVPPCTYFDCDGANDGSTALIPKPCMCGTTLIDAASVNEYCCGLDNQPEPITATPEADCRAASASCKATCPSGKQACEAVIAAGDSPPCSCGGVQANVGQWCCATVPGVYGTKAACDAACLPPGPAGCTTLPMGCDDEQFITGQTHTLSDGSVRLLGVDCGASKAVNVDVTLPWGGTKNDVIDDGASETYLNGAEKYVVTVNWIMCGMGGTTVEIEGCCAAVAAPPPPPPPPATCPNGAIDAGEDCDPTFVGGAGPGGIWKDAATFAACASGICDLTCKCLTCGNGAIDGGEACDPATHMGTPQTGACATPFCNSDCTCPVCGNAAVEAGEECEPPGAGPSLACEDGCDAECHCITTTTLPHDTALISERSRDIGCHILIILQMIAASVAVLLIVVAGVKMTGAEESPEIAHASRESIRNIIIGLIIVIMALQLVNGIFGAELGTLHC